MWRATLRDGRVVLHDGHNTPQEILSDIRVFEVVAPSGGVVARLEPADHQRVVFRWARATNGGASWTEGVKVGFVDRVSGDVSVRLFDGRGWSDTDVVLTPAEVA